jgi:phosphoglycolate phosphatase
MKYKHVIWAWNGTLLNDVALGHRMLNYLQNVKGIAPSSFEDYRAMFTFPITDFYKKAGLFENMESFQKLADIYIKEYERQVGDCFLQDGAEEVLDGLEKNKITSSILTASLESMARSQIKHYGIDKYFIAVTGKDDYYASGKCELVLTHLSKIEYSPQEIVFVGDTLHDAEIAHEIECDCILVQNGHQEIERLSRKDINIAKDLREVYEKVLSKA